jgi:hypothetical protein
MVLIKLIILLIDRSMQPQETERHRDIEKEKAKRLREEAERLSDEAEIKQNKAKLMQEKAESGENQTLIQFLLEKSESLKNEAKRLQSKVHTLRKEISIEWMHEDHFRMLKECEDEDEKCVVLRTIISMQKESCRMQEEAAILFGKAQDMEEAELTEFYKQIHRSWKNGDLV